VINNIIVGVANRVYKKGEQRKKTWLKEHYIRCSALVFKKETRPWQKI